jgi:hypothetical protein
LLPPLPPPPFAGDRVLLPASQKGLHTRKADGGLELPLKVVSARLGHASISITADRYGHLFPSSDDGSELAAAEKAILRTVS